MTDDNQSRYRWYMLALLALTGTFVTAIPYSCMPALFKEISDDLGLSLVQIGTIWGMGNLAGIFVSVIGGIIGDRFSLKLILSISCILAGVTGALRGLSTDFATLAAAMFANGIIRLIIPISITKSVGLWFKGKNLGMAMGISAMGMGLGLMLGPLISATYMSPLLDGWRNVLFVYGGIAVLIGIVWFIFGKEPQQADSTERHSGVVPVRQSLSRLIRLKTLWFIGLTLLFRMGGIMGMTGYLPLYLRNRGWAPASADGTLSTFYAVSSLFVVPLSSLSDKIGSRKLIIFVGIVVTIICLGLLPLVDGAVIWLLMVMSGMFMDGIMAITSTILLETEGVGPAYSGTALGIIFTIAHFGTVFSPPIGNSFAGINPGLPFAFWTFLSVFSLFTLAAVKETGWRKKASQAADISE
jgi:MFS family permease